MKPPPPQDVRIARLGGDGDGLGVLTDGSKVFAPFTLPGELARLRPFAKRGDAWAADVVSLVVPSAERAAAPCPHFGACGGCALQHWANDSYAAWKAGLLTQALRKAGLDAPVAPLVQSAPGARRRIDLAARRVGRQVVLGLHGPRADAVVDLQTCVVLHPALRDLLQPLRAILARLGALSRSGSVIANLLDSGPDLLLRTDADLSAPDRTALATFAAENGIPRIAWARGAGAPETACQVRTPSITLGGVRVIPPPGTFLQASADGEAAITRAVIAGLMDKLSARARVVELFAGCGTLSFPLSMRARVSAFEGDPAAAGALRAAANAAVLASRISVAVRDLARQPLQAKELADADAIVLDPPYAGAAAQMAAIAKAQPSRVVYVSCNPSALTRDLRGLALSGYRAVAATPIDQFLWSSRLESVTVLERPRRGKAA